MSRKQYEVLGVLLALISVFLCPFQSMAELRVDKGDDSLTLEECVAIALDNNPSLLEGQGVVESQRARILQVAADGRAKLSASASYTYSDMERSGSDKEYRASFLLKQSVYDWGKRDLKTQNAQWNYEAVSQDLNRTRDSVVRSVAEYYYQINWLNRSLMIAEERFRNFEDRLKWAREFYAVGTKPKIEVTAAEADYSNAKMSLTSAVTEIQKAVADLAAAMGIPELEGVRLQDKLDYQEYIVSLDRAFERATQARPDLKAQIARVDASKAALNLARKGLTPDLNANTGYYTYGEGDVTDRQDWRFALELSVPLVDGGLTKAQTEQARADLYSSQAKLESLLQDIMKMIRKGVYSVEGAYEAILTSQESERYAKEQMDLAKGRYKAGVGDSLEISDAIERYATSRNSVAKALYDYRVAQVELEYAVGGMTP